MDTLAEELNEIDLTFEQSTFLEEFSMSSKPLTEVKAELNQKTEKLENENLKIKQEMDNILQTIKFYSDQNKLLDKVSKK